MKRMKKNRSIYFILALFFVILVLNFKREMIEVEKNQNKIIIAKCLKNPILNFIVSGCPQTAVIQKTELDSSLFLKNLHFSLLAAGDHKPEMVSNIKNFEKDDFKGQEETDRNKIELDDQFHRIIEVLEMIRAPSLKKFQSIAFIKNYHNSGINIFEKIQRQNSLCAYLIDELKKIPSFSLTVFQSKDHDAIFSLVTSWLQLSPPPIEFTKFPKGHFLMGKSEIYKGQFEVEHTVVLTKDFQIATFETSQAEWNWVMGYNPSFFRTKNYCPKDYTIVNGESLCPNNPVENVSWPEVEFFIKKINGLDKKFSYRLPTEAEWEYASLDNRLKQVWDAENCGDLCRYAWFFRNSDLQTHRKGSRKSGARGVYDMYGNVFEWTSDYFSEFDGSTQIDPVIKKISPWRIIKGGGWYTAFKAMHSSFRCRYEEKYKYSRIGFRLIRQTNI